MTQVQKPWGWYQVLDEGTNYVVKKIYVKPNERFSLQTHSHREEFWTIFSGAGIITLGTEKKNTIENDHHYIAPNQKHRLEAGPEGITFFEIQKGKCSEEDIIRYEDDYNRA